jgi:Transposase IS66 family
VNDDCTTAKPRNTALQLAGKASSELDRAGWTCSDGSDTNAIWFTHSIHSPATGDGARFGMRSTLAGWVGASSELLTPLVEALRWYVLGCGKLHADDTPVPVLAPGTEKTKTGRLWTYVRDDRPMVQRNHRQLVCVLAGSCGASSTTWIRHTPPAWQTRPSGVLESSTRLRARSFAG